MRSADRLLVEDRPKGLELTLQALRGRGLAQQALGACRPRVDRGA